MDGAEPERIGQNRLTERTCELICARQPDQPQTIVKLEKEVGHPLDGASSPYADQMLHDHRFVARGRPQDRGAEQRKLVQSLFHPGLLDAVEKVWSDVRSNML